MLKGQGLPRRSQHCLICGKTEIVDQLLGVALARDKDEECLLETLEKTGNGEGTAPGRDRPHRIEIGQTRRTPAGKEWCKEEPPSGPEMLGGVSLGKPAFGSKPVDRAGQCLRDRGVLQAKVSGGLGSRRSDECEA